MSQGGTIRLGANGDMQCQKSRILVFFNDLVIIFLTTGTRDPKFGTDMKASLLIPYNLLNILPQCHVANE